MAFFTAAHEVYTSLNIDIRWWDFDEFDKVTEPCVKEEYEYHYCESRLYLIRNKREKWIWFAEGRNPGDALSKCLAGGFGSTGR